MCDTMVALADVTAPGVGTLLAKNSDREFDEPQYLAHVGPGVAGARKRLRLTHVEIPAADRTEETWLSLPHWMWGAEMGANAHGVVVGNEAVHGAIPASIAPGVLGMDLLRLTLERSRSAAEAVDVLTGLIDRHGQGGDCSRTRPRTYDNSFIVADAGEAWVVESLGRFWVAERVRTARSISNVLSIGADADRTSPALTEHARREGRLRADGRLDFAHAYRPAEVRPSGVQRHARSCALLAAGAGTLDVASMFAALRDHGPAATAEDRLPRGDELGRTICMHPDHTGTHPGHTAASWVSELLPDRAVHWVTAAPSPCLGVFRPFFTDCPLPDQGPRPDEAEDTASRWWWQEKCLRPALEGDLGRWRAYRAERDALEATFVERAGALTGGDRAASRDARATLVQECWDEADALQRRWATSD